MRIGSEKPNAVVKWCRVHDGFPPIRDSKGYHCENCGKTACAMDFFETEKGKRCGNCLKELPTSEKTLEQQEQFELVKARAKIAKTTILFSEVFLLQSASLLFVDTKLKYGIINTSIAFYMMLAGFVMIVVAGVLFMLLNKKKPVARARGEKTVKNK